MLLIQLLYSYFSHCHVNTTNSIDPSPLYKLHTSHNSSTDSGVGLTLKMPARIPVWVVTLHLFINSVDKTKCLCESPGTCISAMFFYIKELSCVCMSWHYIKGGI